MTRYFFDTSALFKHYRPEVGSDKVHALLSQANSVHLVSRLLITEFSSVLSNQARRGLLSPTERALCQDLLINDLVRGNVHMLALNAKHLERAESLLANEGLVYGLQTLDALHLAVALQTATVLPIDYFVAADKKLLRVAQAVGFKTIDPEA
jgi:predicted nucleic acid-binding protein